MQELARDLVVPSTAPVAPDYWLHVVGEAWEPGDDHLMATAAGHRRLWVRPGEAASWLQCGSVVDAGALRLALAHALAVSDGACIHGAAVVAPGGAGLLVLGPSGSGKSTVAAGALAAGGSVVSDDTVRVWRTASGAARVAPLRRDLLLRESGAKLLRDAVDAPIEMCREGADARWRLTRSIAQSLFCEHADVQTVVVLEPDGWRRPLSAVSLAANERLAALLAAVQPFVLQLMPERERTVALLSAVAEHVHGVRLESGSDPAAALRLLGW